ncbi:hypothetical protein Csa_023621, partial [Cucumis sativus]
REREREETKLPHSPTGGDLGEAKDGGVREKEVSGGFGVGGGVEVGGGSWVAGLVGGRKRKTKVE